MFMLVGPLAVQPPPVLSQNSVSGARLDLVSEIGNQSLTIQSSLGRAPGRIMAIGHSLLIVP